MNTYTFPLSPADRRIAARTDENVCRGTRPPSPATDGRARRLMGLRPLPIVQCAPTTDAYPAPWGSPRGQTAVSVLTPAQVAVFGLVVGS